MGLYDSFLMKIKCPYSGAEQEVEFQTKQFSCSMSYWKQGEKFTEMNITEGIIEGVYSGCRCEACKFWEDLMHKYDKLNSWGFGRGMECDILIKNGIIEKAINIRKTDENYPKAPKKELDKLHKLNDVLQKGDEQ